MIYIYILDPSQRFALGLITIWELNWDRSYPFTCLNPYPLVSGIPKIFWHMVSAGIIERKLRRTKVRLFTVPCCSIILFSSEGMKKKCI